MVACLRYLALFALFACCSGYTTDFCKLGCGEEHTVCKRKPCYRHAKCGEKYAMVKLNDTSRGWLLDVHNDKRNLISRISKLVTAVMGAGDVRVLSYSKELEFVAQCKANSCNIDNHIYVCETTSKFDNVNENVWNKWVKKGDWEITYDNVKECLDSWFFEYKDITTDDIKCYGCQVNTKEIGHFTQLAWAKTTHVGCGVTKYGGGKGVNVIIICNYGPGGNVIGKPVFNAEKGCDGGLNCTNGMTCNKEYPFTCGEYESLAMDTWTPPFVMGSEKFSGSATAVCLLVVMAIFYF